MYICIGSSHKIYFSYKSGFKNKKTPPGHQGKVSLSYHCLHFRPVILYVCGWGGGGGIVGECIIQYLAISQASTHWIPTALLCPLKLGQKRLCMPVCSVAQLCSTLWDPVDCSPPGFFVHGIFPARILEWVAISSSRESSQPRDWTQVSCVSRTGRQIFHHWATWKAFKCL